MSPVLQKTILGADVVSILSTNQSEQRQALKNALYDGLVGFASAGITTGILGNDAVNSIEQKRTIGAYYKKVFNELDIDVNNIAVYLEEISGSKNTDLYNSAEAVLNGDKSDSAVADMMLKGFEQGREAQRFVYAKIGEQLNENSRYTADKLIKQYEKLSSNGIRFSKSIADTYNELVNVDENISKGTFNYLVGKLSATMDAILPRASVEAEVIKRISNDIEENGLPHGSYPSTADAVPVSTAVSVGASALQRCPQDTRTPLGKGGLNRNDNVKIDENAFVEGMWKDSPNTSKDNVEKSQLESVENVGENGIINYKLKERSENIHNDTNNGVFKIEEIERNLLETNIGRLTLDYIEKNNMFITFNYDSNSQIGICGEIRENDITIYPNNCESFVDVCGTLIHETAHEQYNWKYTQEDEINCYLLELFHRKMNPSKDDIIKIINFVKNNYSYLPKGNLYEDSKY